jgi:hypothetical protein
VEQQRRARREGLLLDELAAMLGGGDDVERPRGGHRLLACEAVDPEVVRGEAVDLELEGREP